MTDRVCFSVIPRDRDSAPSGSDNGALIGGARSPANAVANLEKSGLIAGHFLDSRPLPAHCVHRAGKIRRPGCVGRFTLENPVPSQAGHLISATGSLSRFIKFALQKGNPTALAVEHQRPCRASFQ